MLLASAATAAASLAPGQDAVSPAQRARIDDAVASVLGATGAPGASVALVADGRIAHEKAYGAGRLGPETKAASSMRYSIGSVSKQFTATAVLLLAEEGRLALDDRVGRWLPDLTRANGVTVRQLLSMTAGYPDYWPHDYVFPAMREPTTPEALLDRWARRPLDFEPGTRWQYSNTNYVIAGLIVERVSGMRLFDFLRERVFGPLGMASVQDADAAPLGPGDAGGYLRNALGPLRPAPKEASGWLFAAGQLAMTAGDLARWNISVIDQTVLRPASYRTMQGDVPLASGLASGYGLGVTVRTAGGRRRIAHGGAVSGYVTASWVYPDERVAIVVLSNIYPGATGVESTIADRISAVAFEATDAEAARALEQARGLFAGLQEGRIDRSLLSPNANAYFTDEVLSDFASSLGPLGAPGEFVPEGQELRGGMTFRAFRVRCGGRALRLTTRTLADGKLEQYLVERVD